MATQSTLYCVMSHLAMQSPAIIGLPSDQPNIKLIVHPYPSIHSQLAEE